MFLPAPTEAIAAGLRPQADAGYNAISTSMPSSENTAALNNAVFIAAGRYRASMIFCSLFERDPNDNTDAVPKTEFDRLSLSSLKFVTSTQKTAEKKMTVLQNFTQPVCARACSAAAAEWGRQPSVDGGVAFNKWEMQKNLEGLYWMVNPCGDATCKPGCIPQIRRENIVLLLYF